MQHRVHDKIKACQVATLGQQCVIDPRDKGNRQYRTSRQPVRRHTTQRNRCAHQTDQRVRPNCEKTVINPQRARHRRAIFLHRHACANTKRHSNRKGNHPGHCPCDLYQSAASPWTYLQSQYGHSTQPCFLAICSQTRGWPNAPSPPSQAIRHWSVILVSGAESVMNLPLGWGHARCL